MRKYLFSSYLLFSVGLMAQNEPFFQAAISKNITFESATAYSAQSLHTRLVQLFGSQSIISVSDESEVLIIQPFLSINEKGVTNTAPPLITLNIDLNISLVNSIDGTVFHTAILPLRGVGKTDNKAYTQAFNLLRFKKKEIKEFVDVCREKVADYYEKQCSRIISEALNFTNQSQYDKAIARLGSIPSSVTKCYAEISQKILENYQLSQNKECKQYLNIAESAISLRNYRTAAEAISQISPEANCYKETDALKEAIKKATGDEYEKAWAFRNKDLESLTKVLVSKYSSENISSEELLSKVQSNSGGSNGNQVIINNNGTSSPTKSQSANTSQSQNPPENAESPKAVFKIVSPISRSSTGEILIKGNKVTIYGLIDEPRHADKLHIDKLETSWSKEGVFKRELILEDETKEVIVELTSKNGRISKDVIFVRKNGEAPPEDNYTSVKAENTIRKALIIGNNNYTYVGKLKNAKNDAEDIAQTLESLGFQVESHFDADYETMRQAMTSFAHKIRDANVALFYYSGHGVELERKNYLIPVNAKIEDPLDIKLKTVPTSTILKAMELINDNNLNIVILDACRNNPFPTGKRGGAGLARITPPAGMLIAYATEPGSTASDGTGENGLYTGELIKQMKIPQRIEDVFMNTRNEVERKSRGFQRPWEEARLKGVFYLKYQDQ